MQHRLSPNRARGALPLLLSALALLVACGGGSDDGGGDGGVDREIADDAGGTDEMSDDALADAIEPCGAITIARMDWSSAEAIAEIDRLILEEGYGCEATLVEGDTVPTFESMAARGEPDLAPALWITSLREPLDAAVEAGDLVLGAETLRDGGTEDWYITRSVAEANPELRSIEDALARPELFPSAPGDAAGAFHNCPPGWNCQVINENLFRAYGADAMGFVLVDTVSAEGLDGSVARAVQNDEGWLGYYWSPTALLGRFDLVRLEGAPHDAAEWARCTTVPNCPDPAVNGYPRSEVRAVVTADFAAKAGVAMDYVSGRGWDNDTVNAVLAWMQENEASGEEGARHFLENFESVWTTWVDEATAERVRAAL